MGRQRRDIAQTTKLNVPLFTQEEANGLMEADPVKRALAWTKIVAKGLPAKPEAILTAEQRTAALGDAFQNAFTIARGQERLVSYAIEDFNSFVRDYAKLAPVVGSINVNTAPINFYTNVPPSPLDEQVIDVNVGKDIDDLDLGDDDE